MLETVASNGAFVIILSDAVEIVLFGTYAIFFTFALIILTICKRPLPVDWAQVSAILALFVFCMAHTSLVTTDRHTVFTSDWPRPTGPEMSGILRIQEVLFKTCCFVSELIHRCWTVWDYRYAIVVVPFLMALVGMACALVGPVSIDAAAFVSPFVAPRDLVFDLVFCILGLLIFALSTALIIVQLRRVSAPAREIKSVEAHFWSLVGICIEAGVLLILAQLLVAVLLILDNPGILVAESFATQIYGIVPTMMIIRIAFRFLPRGRRWDSSSPQFSTFLSTIYAASDDTGESGESGEVELQSLRDGRREHAHAHAHAHGSKTA